MKVISIETRTHGRVLIRDAPAAPPKLVVVGFHGYAQSAEDMLTELEGIPGSDRWMLVSVQALHRFYSRRHETVVASWMTRQDREQAIADNLLYVNRAIVTVLPGAADAKLVFIGFSQGVAMAYRAGVLGEHRPKCVIAIGGDIPPDIKTEPVERFPTILISGGQNDEWYNSEKMNADESFLRSRGARVEVFRYLGGHEWTSELRDRIHQQLEI